MSVTLVLREEIGLVFLYEEALTFPCSSFANGRQNGHGHISWANGDCYEGEFVNDLFHGRGMLQSRVKGVHL